MRAFGGRADDIEFFGRLYDLIEPKNGETVLDSFNIHIECIDANTDEHNVTVIAKKGGKDYIGESDDLWEAVAAIEVQLGVR